MVHSTILNFKFSLNSFNSCDIPKKKYLGRPQIKPKYAVAVGTILQLYPKTGIKLAGHCQKVI